MLELHFFSGCAIDDFLTLFSLLIKPFGLDSHGAAQEEKQRRKENGKSVYERHFSGLRVMEHWENCVSAAVPLPLMFCRMK